MPFKFDEICRINVCPKFRLWFGLFFVNSTARVSSKIDVSKCILCLFAYLPGCLYHMWNWPRNYRIINLIDRSARQSRESLEKNVCPRFLK